MGATAPRPTFIAGILEEHFEQLAFLWGQRQNAIRSSVATIRGLTRLEERIEAHLQGMLATGDGMLPLVEEGLCSDDPTIVFAASLAMLRLGVPTVATRVFDAFAAAEGPALDGLREAMCCAASDQLLAPIGKLFREAPAPIAVAAAEVLCYRAKFKPQPAEIERFIRDADPAVRRRGWLVVGHLALPVDSKLYSAAVRDKDPGVKQAAIAAAAWCRNPGILALGRELAATPTPDHLDALRILAILGGPEDLPKMMTVAKAVDLGPDRFGLVGTFGHPALIEVLLTEMEGADPAAAAAAGAAFAKMTGHNVDSGRKATVPPAEAGGDEFEAEFLDEVAVPDPKLARQKWEGLKPRLGQVVRLCAGEDASRGLSAEGYAMVDMESRWEICLRSKFNGSWAGSSMNLEVFPQS